MKRLTFYRIATWALLFLNIAMLAFFFFTKPPHHQPPNVTETLQLDEAQHQLFKKSAQKHREKMKNIHSRQRELLQPYFQTLLDDSTTQTPDSILQQIQELEQNKIISTYQHFEEIKTMLRPDQEANFAEFMHAILERLLPIPQKGPSRPKDS